MPPPPPGIRLAETPDGFEVSTSFRHPLFTAHAVLVATVATAAAAGMDGWAIHDLRRVPTTGIGFEGVLILGAALIMTCIAFSYCVGTFIHLFGTWTFRLAGDEATARTRFFRRKSGRFARTFRWSDVREFSVTLQDGNPPYEEFAFVMRDGERIIFLDSIRGKKLAFLTDFFQRKVAESRGSTL